MKKRGWALGMAVVMLVTSSASPVLAYDSADIILEEGVADAEITESDEMETAESVTVVEINEVLASGDETVETEMDETESAQLEETESESETETETETEVAAAEIEEDIETETGTGNDEKALAKNTSETLAVDEAYFPDAAFRAYISDNIDTDQDGMLSHEEIEETVVIDVTENTIGSLDGIEYFTALSELYCSGQICTAAAILEDGAWVISLAGLVSPESMDKITIAHTGVSISDGAIILAEAELPVSVTYYYSVETENISTVMDVTLLLTSVEEQMEEPGDQPESDSEQTEADSNSNQTGEIGSEASKVLDADSEMEVSTETEAETESEMNETVLMVSAISETEAGSAMAASVSAADAVEVTEGTELSVTGGSAYEVFYFTYTVPEDRSGRYQFDAGANTTTYIYEEGSTSTVMASNTYLSGDKQTYTEAYLKGGGTYYISVKLTAEKATLTVHLTWLWKDVTDLTLGEEASAVILEGGDEVFFRYTVPEGAGGRYTLTSEEGSRAYGYLYDGATGNMLTYWKKYASCFVLTWYLEEGCTYYYKVSYSSADTAGIFSVMLERDAWEEAIADAVSLSLDTWASGAFEVEAGESFDLNAIPEGGTLYYKYDVPEDAGGTYKFGVVSSDGSSLFCSVCDAAGNVIEELSGLSYAKSQYYYTLILEAGMTYYFKLVCQYRSSSGAFRLFLSRDALTWSEKKEMAQELTLDVDADIDLTEGDEAVYYQYTAGSTSTYRLISAGNSIYLYSNSGTLMSSGEGYLSYTISSGSTYYFEVRPGDSEAEYVTAVLRKDNTFSTMKSYATELELGTSVTGTIIEPGKTIWYSFTVPDNGTATYQFELTESPGAEITFYNSNGNSTTDVSGDSSVRVRKRLSAGATWYITVQGVGNATGTFKAILTAMDDTELTVGELVTVTEPDKGEWGYLKYTVPSDAGTGYYRFWTSDSRSFQLYDAQNDYVSISGSIFSATFSLTAGKTYYFGIYGQNSVPESLSVKLVQLESLEASAVPLALDDVITGTPSEASGVCVFSYVVPEGTGGQYEFYSLSCDYIEVYDDEGTKKSWGSPSRTVSLEENEQYYFLIFTDDASEELQVYLEKRRSWVDYKKEAQILKLNTADTAQLSVLRDTVCFKYTVPNGESGKYQFSYTAEDADLVAYVTAKTTPSEDSGYGTSVSETTSNGSLTCMLQEGTTYYFEMESGYGSYGNWQVLLEKRQSIDEIFDTVSVSAESLTAGTEITEEIRTVDGEVVWYTFTPTEAGFYLFSTDTLSVTDQVYNSAGILLDESYSTLGFVAAANETYYIRVPYAFGRHQTSIELQKSWETITDSAKVVVLEDDMLQSDGYYNYEKRYFKYTVPRGKSGAYELDGTGIVSVILYDSAGNFIDQGSALGCTLEEQETYYFAIDYDLYSATFVLSAGHGDLTHVEAKEATCTEEGNIEYWYCSICGKYFSDEEGTAELTGSVSTPTVHSFEQYIMREATCTENGILRNICSFCGKYEDEEVPATGHTWDDGTVVQNATCTADGTLRYTCISCQEEKDEVLEALGHEWPETWTTALAATCTTDGLAYRICQRSGCGELETEILEASGHSWGEEQIVEADEETLTSGRRYRVCEDCQMEETLEILIPETVTAAIQDILDSLSDAGDEPDDYQISELVENTAAIDNQQLIDNGSMELVTVLEQRLAETGCNVSDETVTIVETTITVTEDETDNSYNLAAVSSEESSASAFLESSSVTVDGAAVTVAAVLLDENSGITAEAGSVYSAEVVFSEAGSEVNESGQTVYSVNISLYILKDGVRLSDTAQQLSAPVQITMPVPDTYVGLNFCLYHLNEDGAETELSYTDNGDGTITFAAASFSTFEFRTENCGTGSHTLGEQEIIEEATCTTSGIASSVCSVCGTTVYETILPTGHSYELTVEEEAGCTSSGRRTYTCQTCGSSYEEIIPATGHSWSVWETVTEPTCTEEGEENHTCTVCGLSSNRVTVASGHELSEYGGVDATCTEEGHIAYWYCEICGKYFADSALTAEVSPADLVIAATGHTWDGGTVTKTATCAATGVKTYTCTACGATKTETISKLTTHTATGTWVTTKAATCTTAGTRVQYCRYCGTSEVVKSETIAATGHSWDNGVVTTEATTTAAGVMTYTCTACGATKTEAIAKLATDTTDSIDSTDTTGSTDSTDTTDPAGTTHTHTATGTWVTMKEATCTEAGTRVQYCSECGSSVVVISETIAATGHSYGEWTTTSEATVFAPETQTHTCEICGETVIREYGTTLTPTITVNASSIKLKKKQKTTALKVTGLAEGDSIVSWKSSNTKVVTVTSAGKITAKNKTGKAIITVTLASGLTKDIKVTVQKAVVKTTKITVVSKKVSLSKGKSYTLLPVITPITSVQKVTYKTSDKKVATVSSKGKIVAKKKGTATITIESGSKSIKVKVTVK
ncbi:MAG: Ig-like domain-containing protein [Lachnospiraceae bacterium]|nr:Ig-like domain-containing protein [Lachnospiraceae bacterium]